jgi:excisionase family DNA binding protein
MQEAKREYTLEQAAAHAGVSVSTLYRLIKKGTVKTTAAPRRTLISEDELGKIQMGQPGRPRKE